MKHINSIVVVIIMALILYCGIKMVFSAALTEMDMREYRFNNHIL